MFNIVLIESFKQMEFRMRTIISVSLILCFVCPSFCFGIKNNRETDSGGIRNEVYSCVDSLGNVHIMRSQCSEDGFRDVDSNSELELMKAYYAVQFRGHIAAERLLRFIECENPSLRGYRKSALSAEIRRKYYKGLHYTAKYIVACYNLSDYENYFKCESNNDGKAIERILLSKHCFVLKNETPVYVDDHLDDRDICHVYVKIRKKGNPSSFWTSLISLEKSIDFLSDAVVSMTK